MFQDAVVADEELNPDAAPNYKSMEDAVRAFMQGKFGKIEPTELESNRVPGANRLLVRRIYRRQAQRQCKRRWRTAIMFFAAMEDSPPTQRRFGPLLGSRFVA